MTTTTANISWITSAVERENYTVFYNGLELQGEPRVAQWIVTYPTDIVTTSQVYYIVLEDLEEANTYNYTVQLTTNCKGIANTTALQFTTLPDRESTNLQISVIMFSVLCAYS